MILPINCLYSNGKYEDLIPQVRHFLPQIRRDEIQRLLLLPALLRRDQPGHHSQIVKRFPARDEETQF